MAMAMISNAHFLNKYSVFLSDNFDLLKRSSQKRITESSTDKCSLQF